MQRRITFVVYTPSSMVYFVDDQYDPCDWTESSIQIMEFTEFARREAHDYLVRVFKEDLRRRENQSWIVPVIVTALVDGQHLDNVHVDTAVDVQSVINQARTEAER